MIADDGVTPILMDFGSTMRARIPIENRQQALLQQVSLQPRSMIGLCSPCARISLLSKALWPTERQSYST